VTKTIDIRHCDTIDRLREELAALAAMVGSAELLQGRELRGLASLLDAHVYALDQIGEALSEGDTDGGHADV
jgi:hypothetical protein